MNTSRFVNQGVRDNIRRNEMLQIMLGDCKSDGAAEKLIAIRTEQINARNANKSAKSSLFHTTTSTTKNQPLSSLQTEDQHLTTATVKDKEKDKSQNHASESVKMINLPDGKGVYIGTITKGSTKITGKGVFKYATGSTNEGIFKDGITVTGIIKTVSDKLPGCMRIETIKNYKTVEIQIGNFNDNGQLMNGTITTPSLPKTEFTRIEIIENGKTVEIQTGIFDGDELVTGAVCITNSKLTYINIVRQRKVIEIHGGIFENDKLIAGKIEIPNFDESGQTKVTTILDAQPTMIEIGVFDGNKLITGTAKFLNFMDSKLSYKAKIANGIEVETHIGIFDGDNLIEGKITKPEMAETHTGIFKDDKLVNGSIKTLNFGPCGIAKIEIIKNSIKSGIKIGSFDDNDELITGTAEYKNFSPNGSSKVEIFNEGNLVGSHILLQQNNKQATTVKKSS